MKHIAKAKLRSWYGKGIKMIFAKILYPDFFAAAMVFHLVKLSICWNENHENLEHVRPVGSGGGGGWSFMDQKLIWTPQRPICFEWSWNKESSFLLLTYKLLRITTMLFADSFFQVSLFFYIPLSPEEKSTCPYPIKSEQSLYWLKLKSEWITLFNHGQLIRT